MAVALVTGGVSPHAELRRRCQVAAARLPGRGQPGDPGSVAVAI